MIKKKMFPLKFSRFSFVLSFFPMKMVILLGAIFNYQLQKSIHSLFVDHLSMDFMEL